MLSFVMIKGGLRFCGFPLAYAVKMAGLVRDLGRMGETWNSAEGSPQGN